MKLFWGLEPKQFGVYFCYFCAKMACEAALGLFLQETNLLKGQVMLYLNPHPLPLQGACSNKLRVTVRSHFTCCTSTWAQSPFYPQQNLSAQTALSGSALPVFQVPDFFPFIRCLSGLSTSVLIISFTGWCREFSWILICHWRAALRRALAAYQALG